MAELNYLNYEELTYFKERLDEEYAPIAALQFKGTVATISALPTVAGVDVGSVYNVTTGGTTTADFVEGAGETLQNGSNVVAVNAGTELLPVMKWDILGGVFDISDRLQFGNALPAAPTDGQTFLYMGNTTYTYSAASLTGDENPSELGLYEEDGSGGYQLTADTTVEAGKTYYTRAEEYLKGVIYKYNDSASEWVPQSSGDTMVPITRAQIDALFD